MIQRKIDNLEGEIRKPTRVKANVEGTAREYKRLIQPRAVFKKSSYCRPRTMQRRWHPPPSPSRRSCGAWMPKRGVVQHSMGESVKQQRPDMCSTGSAYGYTARRAKWHLKLHCTPLTCRRARSIGGIVAPGRPVTIGKSPTTARRSSSGNPPWGTPRYPWK